MKLSQLITEATLASYQRNYAGPRLGPTMIGAPDGSTVKEIKAALSKHQLYIPGQKGNPANKAWIGDNTGEWTQALSDAIILWKRSINAQDASAKLDARTPELSPRAIDYLINKKLHTRSSIAGRLDLEGNKAQSTPSAPVYSGKKIDVGTVINTPTSSIKTVKDFLNAITFSGWAIILEELIAKKGLVTRSKGLELQRMMKEIYVKQNHSPAEWLLNWEDNVLREHGEDMEATLLNGDEMPFHPMRSGMFDQNWGSMQQGSQRLYEYFKVLGNGLLRKYQQQLATAKAKDDAKQTVDTKSDLDPNAVAVWARDMFTALDQGWFEYIPVLDGTDESTVKDLMAELKTAGDWDLVAAKYNNEYAPKVLSKQLVNTLTEDDYNNFVVRNLSRIRKINPQPLFYAIKFGTTQDSVEVEVNDTKYTVMKARKNGNIEIKHGTKEIRDVILIDLILRAAINKTGGAVPDFNIDPTAEMLETAATFLIITIQNEAAFMVPYYTSQKPFDQMIAPGMGRSRLIGLQREAARLLANNYPNENVIDWIASQIKADAEMLIASEELHWDRRWGETGNSRLLKDFGGILDVKDATEDEIDLVDRLEAEISRDEAVADLLSTNDPSGYYERIYRIYKREFGETFDATVFKDKTDQVRKYIVDDTPLSERSFAAIVQTDGIGIAKAAPYTVARLFEESMKPGFWSFQGGTDDELADALTNVILDREDYVLVNEYYRMAPISANDDLIDDFAKEQWFGLFKGKYYNRIAEAIGQPTITDLARAELDPQLLNVLSDLGEDPVKANLEKVRDLVSANNNYWAQRNNENQVTKLINGNAINSFFNMLDYIRNQRTYEDDEQEIFFDILDSVHKSVLKLVKASKNPVNRSRFDEWKKLYETAKTEWFSE